MQQSVFLGGQASWVARVGKRLVASVERAGSDAFDPRGLIALDWRSGRLIARRSLGGPVGPLADGRNDLWALQVRPGTLLRLNPRTLASTAPPLVLSPDRTLGLAFGAGYVWATASDAGEVLRIEPETRRITRVRVGGFPIGILVAGGGVWYVDRARGEVIRLEPRTLRPLGEPIRVGAEASWLGTAGGSLVVGSTARGTVIRIDVRSGKQVGPPIRVTQRTKDAPAFAIARAGTSVS